MTIDAEIQAFIADSDRFYPPDTASRPIAEQRRLYDAYAASFALARPGGLIVEDAGLVLADRAIPLRRYRPAESRSCGTIVYAHGGGFMLGSLASHDGIVARIAARTGVDVVAIDYRLAPEHLAPAALDDVAAVTAAIARGASPWPDLKAQKLLLVGDSAGGTLVASAALRLARSLNKTPAGLALIYPALGREPAPPARDTEAHAPMLSLADVHFYRTVYFGGRQPEADAYVLDAPSLDGLPPTFLLPAEHDPLRDDCTALAERLRAAGIETRLHLGQGLVHGFLRAIDRSKAAAGAFDALIRFLVSRLQGLT